MNNQTLNTDKWSPWHYLNADAAVPDEPGVYEIRTNFEFSRLRGSSSLVTIGSATASLRKRLCEQRFNNAVRYQNRAEKWLTQAGYTLEFRFTTVSGVEARYLEALRLMEYENKHWELPPGNEALPTTAIRRYIEQRHGRFTEKTLRDLLEHHGSPDKVASVLGVSPAVVENLVVYWGIISPRNLAQKT